MEKGRNDNSIDKMAIEEFQKLLPIMYYHFDYMD
jgi:hypothetical protein